MPGPCCRFVLKGLSMRRKPRRCKMDFRVAWVILSLVASVGADAFTFADGASASCVAGGKIVKEVDAEPSQTGLNFTGKTVRISSGFSDHLERRKTQDASARGARLPF